MKRFIAVFTTVCLLAGATVAALNAQNLMDWWQLRDYSPPAEIKALADNSSLNDHGRKLFYVYKPELLQKKDFQSSCTVGEATIVLGCYITKKNIYLYDVQDDPRLSGIEEVTAAHEMLHAAYDRLGAKEKKHINELLKETYKGSSDARVQKSVASYGDKDEEVLLNEMHSILGTEQKDLPSELESYYARYFVDRSKVVALANSYAEEFEKRENQIAAYDAQLTNINGEVTRKQAELADLNAVLQSDRARIESLRANPAEFNTQARSYNAKVSSYNNLANQVKTLVDQYNDIVSKRNEIAVQEKELVNAIDTRAEQL